MQEQNIVIAIGAIDPGRTPLMPFIGERLDGRDAATMFKLNITSALLRCGFDVVYSDHTLADAQGIVMRANCCGADGIVLATFGAFGSRKSFNDVGGLGVEYPHGRMATHSRVLCEDVCARLCSIGKCAVSRNDYALGGAACPSIVIFGGYLTEFNEAKRSFDPDYSATIAEHVAIGLCEYYGLPYRPRTDLSAYRDVCSVDMGKRGRTVKLLQTLLCLNGYSVDIDGMMGRATADAVKELCKNNGTDNLALSAIKQMLLLELPETLGQNSKHTAALYVKRKLHSKLYLKSHEIARDGDLLSAMNGYLSDIGLPPVDCITKSAIESLSEVGGGKPRLF